MVSPYARLDFFSHLLISPGTIQVSPKEDGDVRKREAVYQYSPPLLPDDPYYFGAGIEEIHQPQGGRTMRAIVQHRCIFTAILMLAGFFYVQVQANEHSKNEIQQVLLATTLLGYHEFNYTFADRPDPFLPFIDIKPRSERVAPEKGKLIDPKQVLLTKLQKFEPGQLKLVAVLAFQDKKIAMLEDVTGKGHLVEQDTLIGRHGVVTSIEKDRLLVTETYETPSKRKIVNKIPLYMHQQD